MNQLTRFFLSFVEETFDLFVELFKGYSEQIIRGAATLYCSAVEDPTFALQLRSNFILTRDEWISSIHQIDGSTFVDENGDTETLDLTKAARRWCYKAAENSGLEIGHNGCPIGVEPEAWWHYVELVRMSLAAEHAEVQKLFSYMPGIGFVVKAPGWEKVCRQLRTQQLALAALGCDTEGMDLDHVTLFNLTESKTGVITSATLGLSTYDKGETFDAKMGACQNQQGHSFSRLRGDADNEDDSVYDGLAGIMAAHDMHLETVEEGNNLTKQGFNRGRVKDVIIMDRKLNRIDWLQQDANIFDEDHAIRFLTMGWQRQYVDKVHDPRDASWHKLHKREYVHDPMTLSLNAHRSLNDPDGYHPALQEAFDDHTRYRCILDPKMTNEAHGDNNFVFGVSKAFEDRTGRCRYVVHWGYKEVDGWRKYWKNPMVYKVGFAADWTYCIERHIEVTKQGKYGPWTRYAQFVGIGVEGKMKDDILDLMGIARELITEYDEDGNSKSYFKFFPRYTRTQSQITGREQITVRTLDEHIGDLEDELLTLRMIFEHGRRDGRTHYDQHVIHHQGLQVKERISALS